MGPSIIYVHFFPWDYMGFYVTTVLSSHHYVCWKDHQIMADPSSSTPSKPCNSKIKWLRALAKSCGITSRWGLSQQQMLLVGGGKSIVFFGIYSHSFTEPEQSISNTEVHCTRLPSDSGLSTSIRVCLQQWRDPRLCAKKQLVA